MIYKLILTLTAIALLSGNAAAWNEPDTVRGVPWGASISETTEILSRSDVPGEKPDCWGKQGPCFVRTRIGPAPVSFQFGFHNDRFVYAFISFKPTDFAALRVAFVERYGAPTSRDERQLQNRMGATFTNEILTWNGEKVRIRLNRYGSKLDSGNATITTVEEDRRQNEEATKELKKGQKDL